jgi:5-methylthioribose kinase
VDEQIRIAAKQKSLDLGKFLIKQRKEIKNLDGFIATVKDVL